MFGLCVIVHVFIVRLQFAVENVVVEEEETVKKKKWLVLSASALLQGVIFGTHNEMKVYCTED